MFWEFIVPLVIVIIFCYCLMPKFKYGVDRHISKTNFLLDEITLNDLRRKFENKHIQNTLNTIQKSIQDNQKIQNDLNNLNHLNKKTKQALNSPPELRMDTCSFMKVNECPIGSYKQCTNNVMAHSKCDCSDQKSFEVCSNNDMNDLLNMDEVLKNEIKEFDKYATRVNRWKVGYTKFNEPANLHIQRTSPYVEEL